MQRTRGGVPWRKRVLLQDRIKTPSIFLNQLGQSPKNMRLLGVDPGRKYIGIALSDPTGTIATPLTIIPHTSRQGDAIMIRDLARKHQVEKIVVGQALDHNNKPTVSGRNSARLAAAIQNKMDIPVELWDESYSTQKAQSTVLRKRSRSQKVRLDSHAAAVILQSYIDTHLPF